MRYNYWTENTCSQMISFDLEGDVVTNIKYMGGCDGNLQSIERILDGWRLSRNLGILNVAEDRLPVPVSLPLP